MSEIRPEFGAELRRRRESAGMSLTALATAAHFTKGYLSKVENGKVRANRHLAEMCDQAVSANGALLALVANSPVPPQRRAGGLLGLPDVTRHFVGRDAEQDRVREVLLGFAPVHVCAIHGLAGVGKTTLALSSARSAEREFPDGCLLFDLHGHTPGEAPVTAAEAAHRVLRVLGVPGERIPPDPDGRANLYRDHLRDKRMLLIFDNVRDAQQVSPLIPAEPRCRVLITSRTRLTALDDAEHLSVRGLPITAAVTLFRSMVGDRVAATDQVVTRIVANCGGLPLAVRIVAARLVGDAGLTVTELNERLADETTRLEELDDGERSVAAALRVSCEHLQPAHRRLFGLLALHPGHEADSESVAALAGLDRGTTNRLLGRLSDAHLITRRKDSYVELHNLVNDFAATHVLPTIPEPERRAALGRLVDQVLLRTRAADEWIEPHRFRPDMALPEPPDGFPNRAAASAWLRAAWPSLVKLCQLAAAHGMAERCWQLAFSLRAFFFHEKLVAPWIVTHRQALAAARTIPDPYAEAILLNNLGMAHLEQGDPRAAEECYQKALAAFQTQGDVHGTTDAMANLGWAQLYGGRPEAALHDLETVLDTYRQAGRTRSEMITLRGMALAATELGRYGEALVHARQARDQATELADVLMSVNCLAWIHCQAGNYEDAWQHYAECLALGEHDGSPHELARAKTGLANIAAIRGELAEAATLWTEAAELAPSLNPLLVGEARMFTEVSRRGGRSPC